MKPVGFDFGTTNTLISIISRGDAINIGDDDEAGRPFPSVIRYEGEKTAVGFPAKQGLASVALGVHGSTVKSPKMYFGDDSVSVGGIDRSPERIAADVIRYVKDCALSGSQRDRLRKEFGGLSHAVATIPVTWNGRRRAALRNAFKLAGIEVQQFVHEPFAALYGHLRSSGREGDQFRSLSRKNLLVVDWGGGTLDITLCRIEDGCVAQLTNGGNADVGGDRFDEAVAAYAVAAFLKQEGIDDSARLRPGAQAAVLAAVEQAKIDLSFAGRKEKSLFVEDVFESGPGELVYRLSREELDYATRQLVQEGMDEVRAVLDKAVIAETQVAKVLVVGGMSAMPAIQSQLLELFGPERVEVAGRSGTLVSEGAAWVAHDERRLVLSKPVELQLARGAFYTLVNTQTEMGGGWKDSVPLYCADPTDGVAKFLFCTPRRLGRAAESSESRVTLATMNLPVDTNGRPLVDRLELDLYMDNDLILKTRATNVQTQAQAEVEIHDLAFGLPLPLAEFESDKQLADPEVAESDEPRPGELTVRANLTGAGLDQPSAKEVDAMVDAIPGEVLERDPFYRQKFIKRSSYGEATDEQVYERLYHRPCASCGRRVNDPDCRCGSRPTKD